jgi:raffinose synthase
LKLNCVLGERICSDAPGKHDFELLKRIVLPDGSVLRALLPGRPTKDCLFTDPARDGVR